MGNKPFFLDPFHALCWQYWNVCRDGLNYYWVDSPKVPKWHKCVGMVLVKEQRKYHKNPYLWKNVLNTFFSNVDIFDIETFHPLGDLLIADNEAFLTCRGYFNLPDYQRSIRSTIKNGSVCGTVDEVCWSKLRNRQGIPGTKNDNGLIDIGCVIQSKIKEKSRNTGEIYVHEKYI